MKTSTTTKRNYKTYQTRFLFIIAFVSAKCVFNKFIIIIIRFVLLEFQKINSDSPVETVFVNKVVDPVSTNKRSTSHFRVGCL
jgi:hypothetical protein